MSAAVEFRIGTTSWTDPSLINSDLFYPVSVRSASGAGVRADVEGFVNPKGERDSVRYIKISDWLGLREQKQVCRQLLRRKTGRGVRHRVLINLSVP